MQVNTLCRFGSQVVIFKLCRVIGISKLEFFNLSGAEKVKQNPRKSKTIPNYLII